MDTSGVEPANVLSQDGPQLRLVPDEDSIQDFSAQSAVESLDMRVRVRGVVGSGNPSDAHNLRQPDVERRPTGDLLAIDFDDGRPAELPENAVVVVDEKLRLILKSGVSQLLLNPGQCRVFRYVDMDDLSAAQFHDPSTRHHRFSLRTGNEDVQGSELDRVLDAEVAGPDGRALVLEEGTPTLRRLAGPLDLGHVLSHGGVGVLDAELDLQLQCDAVFPVLGVAWPSKLRPQDGAK